MAQQVNFKVITITASGRRYTADQFPSLRAARKHIASSLQQNTGHGWYTAEKFAETLFTSDAPVVDPETGWAYQIIDANMR